MPVFQNVDGKLKKLRLLPLDKEKALQKLIEQNLLEVLDMGFIASEYQTTHGGRIDTLAIDSDGAPVIIEYKRNRNDNVINQALSYLKWLKAQKVEFFEMLVTKNAKLGSERAAKINWNNPRVICIAESYSKFDIDTLEVIPLRLELYKFHYYENNIFTLEKVNGEDEKPQYIQQLIIAKQTEDNLDKKATVIDLETHLSKGQPFVRELFLILKEKIFALDENIQEKINNNYVGYKISKMFAEVHIQKSKLLFYLRPIEYNDPEERLYKVPDSYNWVLDRRVYITNDSDIDYVMGLVEQSYKDIL
jgi:predicted transport protein